MVLIHPFRGIIVNVYLHAMDTYIIFHWPDISPKIVLHNINLSFWINAFCNIEYFRKVFDVDIDWMYICNMYTVSPVPLDFTVSERWWMAEWIRVCRLRELFGIDGGWGYCCNRFLITPSYWIKIKRLFYARIRSNKDSKRTGSSPSLYRRFSERTYVSKYRSRRVSFYMGEMVNPVKYQFTA